MKEQKKTVHNKSMCSIRKILIDNYGRILTHQLITVIMKKIRKEKNER
jgi:uncharacterized protein with HEPN domain